jgi:hypothetical protein
MSVKLGHAAPLVTLKPQLERAKDAKKTSPSAPTAVLTADVIAASQKHAFRSTSASRRQQLAMLPPALKLQSALRPPNTSSRHVVAPTLAAPEACLATSSDAATSAARRERMASA